MNRVTERVLTWKTHLLKRMITDRVLAFGKKKVLAKDAIVVSTLQKK